MIKVDKASKSTAFRLKSLIRRAIKAFKRSKAIERLFLIFKTFRSVIQVQSRRKEENIEQISKIKTRKILRTLYNLALRRKTLQAVLAEFHPVFLKNSKHRSFNFWRSQQQTRVKIRSFHTATQKKTLSVCLRTLINNASNSIYKRKRILMV